MSTKRLLIVPVLGLSLLLTGCSGGTDDAKSSPAPSLSASPEPIVIYAEPGLVLYENTSTSIPDQKTIDGVVKYPGGEVKESAVGTLEGVQIQSADLPTDINWESETVAPPPKNKLPAKGEKFVAYRLAVTINNNSAIAPTFAVIVDGARQELTNVLAGEQVLVLSVPEDSKSLVLEIKYDGVVQSLDLDNGKRTSTNVAALYVGEENAQLPQGGELKASVKAPLGVVNFDAVVGDANRTPYLGDLKWANNGDGAWLVINLSTTAGWRYEARTVANTGDNEENWVLTDSKNNTYDPEISDDTSKLVFKIPADELTFTLGVSGYTKTYDGTTPDVDVPATANNIGLQF